MTTIVASPSGYYPVNGSATGGAVQVPVVASPSGSSGPTANAIDGVDGLGSAPAANTGGAGTATAAAPAPAVDRVGTHAGSRDTKIDALKKRAAFMRSMAALGDALPGGPAVKANIEQQASALTDQARKQTAVDWLTNIAWASGASEGIVKALDSATIVVVPDDQLGIDADAAFDEQSDTIRMKASAAKKLDDQINGLARDGIVDAATGVVKDPEALKQSAGYHDIVVTQALIGAHEYTHDQEHAAGKQATDLLPQVKAVAALSGDEQKVAADNLIRTYISDEEYGAYHNQELYQFQMGQAPKSQGWMTIDNQGNPIDKEQAVSNIVDFVKAGGFTAQTVGNIVGGTQYGSMLPGNEVPGRFIPGRFIPGDGIEGRFIPGRFIPGAELPGRFIPGNDLPGRFIPGRFIPGQKLN